MIRNLFLNDLRQQDSGGLAAWRLTPQLVGVLRSPRSWPQLRVLFFQLRERLRGEGLITHENHGVVTTGCNRYDFSQTRWDVALAGRVETPGDQTSIAFKRDCVKVPGCDCDHVAQPGRHWALGQTIGAPGDNGTVSRQRNVM